MVSIALAIGQPASIIEIDEMRVSIVITNYNMGRFVGAAIESAFQVRWPDKEVIICDDGSTDNSRDVIAGFGDRISVVCKPNGGQPSAANAAFPLITGDVVFFLDSDDMLLPEAAEAVIDVWDKRTSKVQFPSLVVDHSGEVTGKLWPDFRSEIPPGKIRNELLRTGSYPTSSTSGNAFAIGFLRELFPVPQNGLTGIDSYLCMAAPLYGDVKTLTRPLAKFRIHESNSWAQQSWKPEKLFHYINEETRRDSFVRERALSLGLTLNPGSLRANHIHVMNRLACKRVCPGQVSFPESRSRLVLDGLSAVANHPFASRKTKLLIACWFILVGFAPNWLARRAVKARYVAGSRSRLSESILYLAGAVGRWKRGRPSFQS
jgi:glycosyltransferase involved in cell wall biosynthesis